ncbi:hypothetical protein MACJ_000417 [Theileria orientalis]|uniref:Uncharacterized protein n=1 Tax=Theileria orientalis TaxID=68886 RepID=A0A976M411_THEOR|nr:hypothetical protein MACJ_000417 [Theileria orientalis]
MLYGFTNEDEDSRNGVDLNLKSDTQSTDQFDYNKLGEYVSYIPKDNNAFKLVKDDKTEIWSASDSSNYSRGVQVELSGDRKAVIIHLPGDKTKVFIKDGTNEPWSEIYEDKINPRSVNVKNDKETYFHSNKLDNDVRTFEAVEGFAFNVVNEGSGSNKVEIWKTTNENEYANKVVVEGDKKVIVYLGDYSTAKVFNKGSEGTWTENTEASTEVTKIYSELGSILSASKTSKTGIINIASDTQSTYQFDYKKDGQYATYTPKGNNAFKLVKDGNTEIWKKNNYNDYALKVEVDLIDDDTKAVTVYMDEDKIKVFKKDDKSKPWNEIYITRVNSESVDINYEHERYFCKNELDDDVRTFIAKTGFLFNDVKEDNTNIWTTSNENEYAKYVVTEGDNKVTIYKADGSTAKVFTKGSDGKWKEDTNDSTTPTKISSKLQSSSLEAITYPKTGININVNIDILATDNFDFRRIGKYATYSAKGDNAFKLVKEDKKEVWKATDASGYSSRVEVQFTTNYAKAIIVFLNDDRTRIFLRIAENGPWNEIDTTKIHPKFVNIDYPHESYFYKNELQDETRTFTPKPSFAFRGIVEFIGDDTVEIWKTDNENEYPNKVVHEIGKKVTLYLADGSTKVFKKDSDGKWKENAKKSTCCGWSCFWRKIKGWLCCKCCGSCCRSSCGPSSGSSETGAGTSGCSSCGCSECCQSSSKSGANFASTACGEGSGTNLSTRGTASSNMF